MSEFVPVPKSLRLAFVGDSFVNGTGDPTCLGWTGRICAEAQRQKNIEITYYNLGIRRQTSKDILDRWQQEVIPRLPADQDGRVIFSFGVNDTTVEAGSTRIAYEHSLLYAEEILRKASQRYPVLMIGPSSVPNAEQNVRIKALSDAFAHLCQHLQIPYLALFRDLQANETWFQEASENDGYHPKAAGYAAFATLVQQWPFWQRWVQ